MERQGLSAPVSGESGYIELFRRLQPVSPVYYSMPGSPPRLCCRSSDDDADMAASLRRRRQVVKGRFRTGQIGYIAADDLELYGTAFRRPLARVGETEQLLLDTMRATGPLSPRHLREETGLLNKQIMPALHRLQRAFAVFEDQEDDRWDRPWCLFASEWPDLDLDRLPWDQAAAEVVERFLAGYVFATEGQIKAWSGFGVAVLRRLLDRMAVAGALTRVQAGGLGEGWVRTVDREERASVPARPSTRVMHRSDPLVIPLADQLRERYCGREVLQYLLIDGEVRGAVCGHWRIRAHDVEDVTVDLTPAEAARRRDEVLEAVALHYAPPDSHILHYMGQRL